MGLPTPTAPPSATPTPVITSTPIPTATSTPTSTITSKKSDKVTVANVMYQRSGKGAVVTGVSKRNKKSYTIASKATIDGVKYPVTSIAKNAFKKVKKGVTITCPKKQKAKFK